MSIAADEPLMRLVNLSAEPMFVRLGTVIPGDDHFQATLDDMPVLPHSEMLVFKGIGSNAIAAIGAPELKAGRLYVTVGHE